MINDYIKRKIVNAIGNYESKLDLMQLQVNTLKNVLKELLDGPISRNYEVSDYLAPIQKQLEEEFDPEALERKAKYLSTEIDKLEKKKTRKTKELSGLVKESTDSISRLATNNSDKRAVSNLQKLLAEGAKGQDILVNFNEVLSQCVSSVIKQLEESNAAEATPNFTEINIQVNDSLQQLLNHLSIPRDLEEKKEEIKAGLEHRMKSDELTKIIDGLTDLVVDSFNLEQNRFKGFLEQLTTQLQDVDVYLNTSVEKGQEASTNSLQLEDSIQANINQIKTQLNTSNSLEDLVNHISKNLNDIGDRIKKYRNEEKIREEKMKNKIIGLKSKLQESQQGAQEIKNLLTYQKYKINHDKLTSLANRESYEEHIVETYNRWQRSEKAFTLAICDIDNFKRINDTFGHLAGDKVLKKVAEILKKSIRKIDFIARIGGEEFAIIFEQTPTETAHLILEKLRHSIETCQFYYRDQLVQVTVSFGMSTTLKEDDIESLFVRADKALYMAKNAGRNRIQIL
ncbi:MAG: GGDEF domain-containing protein [Legionella sp.]|nr:MAG: GGDEF domain-containing protein [Legionella sp.]